jgi:probable F420-dependent oxidoreductase
MRVGFIFATSDIGNDPLAIRDYVQAAEDLGFDSVLLYDHVLGAVHSGRRVPLAGPYDETFPFHEPLVLLGHLAGLTRRIELATGVLVLTQRQTALVAKQAAEIQILSQGRLRLGVGSGWNHVECEAMGGVWSRRGERLDEQVALLRRLWSEPVVSHRGEFDRIDRAGINPLPGQPIPIWFGGTSARAYRRAAATGDGFVFRPDDAEYGDDLASIRAQMLELGRDPAAFGAECFVSYGLGAEHWRKVLRHWSSAGGTMISMQAMDFGAQKLGAIPSGARTTGERIAHLERFIRVIREASDTSS